MTRSESSILEAMQEVERMGADVRLTDAVVLLQAARESVADFVDGIDTRRSVVACAPATPVADAREASVIPTGGP